MQPVYDEKCWSCSVRRDRHKSGKLDKNGLLELLTEQETHLNLYHVDDDEYGQRLVNLTDTRQALRGEGVH